MLISTALAYLLSGQLQGKIGDTAPPLKVVNLTAGITKIEKGNVYVIDFWATWCAACLEDLPRVSAIADAYRGRVEFLGVNTRDEKDVAQSKPDTRAEQLIRIKRFVKNAAPILRFPIAIDDEFHSTSKEWFSMTGSSSLPVSFIVDRNRTVVWFGSSRELESVLPQVVEGTWDAKKFKEQVENQRLSLAKFEEGRSKVRNTLLTQDVEKVVEATKVGGQINGSLATFAVNASVSQSPHFALKLIDRFLKEDSDVPHFQWIQILGKIVSVSRDQQVSDRAKSRAIDIANSVKIEEKTISYAYLSKLFIHLKIWPEAKITLNIAWASMPNAPETERASLKNLLETLQREIP
jgi:thiol-disulfide isomerase/thioredoxin